MAFFAASCGLGLGRENLWLDETFTLAMVQHRAATILALTRMDVHPPLYYLLLHGVVSVLGTSEAALRLPSALAMMGLLALAAFPIRRLLGDRAALSFAVLVAFSPGVFCFAQEARMYALAMLLVTANLVYAMLVVRTGKRHDLVIYAVTMLLAAYTHYYAAIAVVCIALALLGAAGRSRRDAGGPRKLFRALLVVHAAVALLGLPWLLALLGQVHRVRQDFWIPKMSWSLLQASLVSPFGYKFEDLSSPIPAVLSFLALMAVLLYGLRSAGRLLRLGLVLLPCALLAVGLGLSWAIRPVFMPRYMFLATTAWFLAAAWTLSSMKRALRIVGILAIVLPSLPTLATVHSVRLHGKFRELGAFIAAERRSRPDSRRDIVLYTDMLSSYTSRLHIGPAEHVLLFPKEWSVAPVDELVYADPHFRVVRELEDGVRGGSHVWLVESNLSPYSDIRERLVKQGATVVREKESFASPLSFVQPTLTHLVLADKR